MWGRERFTVLARVAKASDADYDPTMRRRARRDSRLPVLLAIVLLARSLVPAGFMPSEGRWIELCTRGGLQAALIDLDTGELIDETHVEPPCPWGVLLAATLPATSPAGLVHAAPDEPARLFDGAPRVASRARVVPPVRAPPNLS